MNSIREQILSGHSLARVYPDHGRTHQIRRHLASIGHPILGDARYGHDPSNRHAAARWALDRTFLHCGRIEVTDPRSGTRLRMESALPGALSIVLGRMGTETNSAED